MRDRRSSPPELPGPTTATPRFEGARRAYLRARHELTVAALDELVLRVRTRHPSAAAMLLVYDDVEDGLYLAGVTDGSGRPLGLDGPLLDDRTSHQIMGNLNGPDLAVLAGVRHDPASLSYEVTLAEREA
jgi:hypothetical protein